MQPVMPPALSIGDSETTGQSLSHTTYPRRFVGAPRKHDLSTRTRSKRRRGCGRANDSSCVDGYHGTQTHHASASASPGRTNRTAADITRTFSQSASSPSGSNSSRATV